MQSIQLPFVCRKTPTIRFLTTATCDKRRPKGAVELQREEYRKAVCGHANNVAHRYGGDPAWMKCGDCEGPVICPN